MSKKKKASGHRTRSNDKWNVFDDFYHDDSPVEGEDGSEEEEESLFERERARSHGGERRSSIDEEDDWNRQLG
jgi:hypothetical protein